MKTEGLKALYDMLGVMLLLFGAADKQNGTDIEKIKEFINDESNKF